jgi:hypothetical protein
MKEMTIPTRKMTRSEAGRLGAYARIITNAEDMQDKIDDYNENPKLCLNCSGAISYKNKSRGKFCSQKCAATYNNKLRNLGLTKHSNKFTLIKSFQKLIIKITKRKKKCLNCYKILGERHNKKYCDITCQKNYQWKEIKLEIENGKIFPAHSRVHKRYLLETQGHICNNCNNTEWMNKPIPLELEHKDGNSENNNPINLELLCPNCHAQTSTYKNKNKGNGRHSRRLRYAEGKSY